MVSMSCSGVGGGLRRRGRFTFAAEARRCPSGDGIASLGLPPDAVLIKVNILIK